MAAQARLDRTRSVPRAREAKRRATISAFEDVRSRTCSWYPGAIATSRACRRFRVLVASGNELVTGIDEQLQLKRFHLRRDAGQALFPERDSPHGDSVSPVVLAPATVGPSLRRGEGRHHVKDRLPRSQELAGKREAEAAGPFDGDDPLGSRAGDPPGEALELAGVRSHGQPNVV